jgi:hypothetical protein
VSPRLPPPLPPRRTGRRWASRRAPGGIRWARSRRASSRLCRPPPDGTAGAISTRVCSSLRIPLAKASCRPLAAVLWELPPARTYRLPPQLVLPPVITTTMAVLCRMAPPSPPPLPPVLPPTAVVAAFMALGCSYPRRLRGIRPTIILPGPRPLRRPQAEIITSSLTPALPPKPSPWIWPRPPPRLCQGRILRSSLGPSLSPRSIPILTILVQP